MFRLFASMLALTLVLVGTPYVVVAIWGVVERWVQHKPHV